MNKKPLSANLLIYYGVIMQEKNNDKSDHAYQFGCPHITEEDIERIAEKAATKAIDRMKDEFYREIGKGFVNKFLVLTGITVVGIASWLHSKGFI